jgi:predicted 2-oxoglutarate/Fe(II)-dependent dioxygenase YbiX
VSVPRADTAPLRASAWGDGSGQTAAMTPGPDTRRNGPCPCGSGRRFKHCCGRRASGPPDDAALLSRCASGIVVVENCLAPATCRRLIDIARRQPAEPGRVLARTTDSPQVLDRESQHRVTTLIKTADVADVFCPLIARTLHQHVLPRYGAGAVEWFEWPDVLRYDPGGRYDVHNDAEVFDPETSSWRRAQDRDLSLLIYLNDSFEGGAIDFPALGRTIQPSAGLLVAFPSDHRFAHAARPVISGTRFVIVSWVAVAGTPRVSTAPRLGVVYARRSSIPTGLPVREIAGAGYYIDPAVRHTP